MSLPNFTDRSNIPTREEAINQIISSIAMEELGLSHIINAEGEKLQYALGTITGITGPEEPLTMDDLLKLNESVHTTLNSTMMNQYILKEKLVGALSSSVLVGPTGPRGPQGPATITVDPIVDDLNPGDAPYVNNNGTIEDVILRFGLPKGATGSAGVSAIIAGYYDDYASFIQAHPTGTIGEMYIAEGILYVWDEESMGWRGLGSLIGPTGPAGEAGTIGGYYDDYASFIQEHPTGTKGEMHIAGGILYIWDEENQGWKELGSLIGPTGATERVIYAQLCL